MQYIIHIASFDIGKVNFSFYIEEINLQMLNHLENISKSKRYNLDGTPTPDFLNILNDVYTNGKKILLKNIDLTIGTNKNKYFDMELCYNMMDTLNEYSEYWDCVDYFVIERQMSFGRKTNTMALKLAQHCESYFINKYGRCDKQIIEFPAYHKTQILGAPQIMNTLKSGKIKYKTLGDRERKKWAIEQAFYILSLREDFETMSDIGLMKKRDDVSDTIVQCQAFKYLYFIDKVKF